MKANARLRKKRTRQRPYHHGSLREAALSEARRELASRGANAISLRAIAAQLGVAPNALYRHFNDKRDLLASLAEEGFRELTERFRAIKENTNVRRFQEMATVYVNFALKKPTMLRLMFGHVMADLPKNSALEQAAENAFMELLDGAAAAAGLPPTSKKSLKLAIAAWSLVHGYSTLRTTGALDFLKPRQLPHIQSLVQFVNFRSPRTMARKSAPSRSI